MNYFLDTNVCIGILRNKNPELSLKFFCQAQESIKISAVVAGELFHGANKSSQREKNLNQVKEFLSSFEIVPFDFSAALIYGKIKARLEKTGNIIGSNDLLIASSVLSEKGILVTNNTREFSRIDGLLLEDWL